MDTAFGEYLKALRLSHDPVMTQEDLAEAIGRSKMTVSQFENGKNAPPRGELLEKIIRALNLDEDESGQLIFLAAKSRKSLPQDIEEYFFNNPDICAVIRTAMNGKGIVDWRKIADLVGDQCDKNKRANQL